MSLGNIHSTRRERGFSLIELLTVLAVLTLVMGVVFKQIITAQHRYRTEEAKLAITQESRESLDLMMRDLRQIGYPTGRMYSSTPALSDYRVAAGLVKYSYNDLWFEGDVNGDGVVWVVRYTLATGTGGACPCILQRSETQKLDGFAPMSQNSTAYRPLLQNVINSGGSGGPKTNGAYDIAGTGPGGVSNYTLYGGLASPRIFEAFDASGAPVAPADIATGKPFLDSIRSIRVTLNVLAPQAGSDLRTGRRAPVSLTATARITNH